MISCFFSVTDCLPDHSFHDKINQFIPIPPIGKITRNNPCVKKIPEAHENDL